MILNAVIKGGSGNDGLVKFYYTGSCVIDGNILRLLDSGSFVLLSKEALVDVFLVGAGGGSGSYKNDSTSNYDRWYYGGGGAGGYTLTKKSYLLDTESTYTATIGAGTIGGNGGSTSFGELIASGGNKGGNAGGYNNGNAGVGGAGGSGGGGGGMRIDGASNSASNKATPGGAGGTNGNNGSASTSAGGAGQGSTTRAFGEDNGELFASGGKGGTYNATPTTPANNTGNGAAGAFDATRAAGGSGIILIRFPEGTELAQVA